MKTSLSRTLSLWVLPGFVAGAAFLGVALLSGALATTPWAMPDAIAQVSGVAAPAGYGFAPVPVLVGIVVHLVLSLVLGAVFTAFVLWRRLYGWRLIVAAVIFITIETPIALWGVMHTLLSATTFQFFLAAVPLWGSVLGHYLYALVLGLLLARSASTIAWKPQPSSTQLVD